MAFKVNPGNYKQGPDGFGGWFNEQGNSNNTNYLKNTANITRDQTKGTVLHGMSDKAIDSMIGTNKTFGNDLYINPITGGMSSVNEGGNWIKAGDARQVYAGLTGQQANMQAGNASTPAPFVQHRDFGDRTNLGAIQAGLIGDLQRGKAPANESYYAGFGGIGTAIPGMFASAGKEKINQMTVDPMKEDLEKKRYLEEMYGR